MDNKKNARDGKTQIRILENRGDHEIERDQAKWIGKTCAMQGIVLKDNDKSSTKV